MFLRSSLCPLLSDHGLNHDLNDNHPRVTSSTREPDITVSANTHSPASHQQALMVTNKSPQLKLAMLGLCLMGLSACQSLPTSSTDASARQPTQTTIPASDVDTTSTSPAGNLAGSETVSTQPASSAQHSPSPSSTTSVTAPVYSERLPRDNTLGSTDPFEYATNPLTVDETDNSEPFSDDSVSDDSAIDSGSSMGNVLTTSPYPNGSQTSNPRSNPPPAAPIILTLPTTPSEPAKSTREALLERARQNSQPTFETKPAVTSSGDNLPAFRSLIQKGIDALKAGKLTEAESSFTRAQRLAPKSSAVYFYLGQVAIKKNQPRKAEAMARRGLVVAQDASRRRALWQLILQSGRMQNNSKVINEASAALRNL